MADRERQESCGYRDGTAKTSGRLENFGHGIRVFSPDLRLVAQLRAPWRGDRVVLRLSVVL